MRSVFKWANEAIEYVLKMITGFAKGLISLADWLSRWLKKSGRGWLQIYPKTDALDFEAVHHVSGDFAVAVGRAGIICRTNDNGLNWEQLESDVQEDLHGVWFVDPSVGYVVGNAGTILKTVDAGESWHSAVEFEGKEYLRFRDVKFWDANNGFVVGGYGSSDQAYGLKVARILRTLDGGANWQVSLPVRNDPNNYWDYIYLGMLHSIAYLDASTLIAVGGQWFVDRAHSSQFVSGAPMLKTTDNGNSWVLIEHPLLTTPYPSPLLCVDFADSNHGVILGERNGAIYTDDGGSHWEEAQIPCINATTYGVSFLNQTHVIGVGTDVGRSGVMLDSRNAGQAWVIPPAPPAGDFKAVSFHDDQNGIAVGHGSTIVSTSDGGVNWTQGPYSPDPMVGDHIMDLSFPERDIGYAVGWFGQLYATSDAGATWVIRNRSHGSCRAVAFADKNRGYFGGNGMYALIAGGQRVQGYDVSGDGQSYMLVSGSSGSSNIIMYDISLVGMSDGFILGKNENNQPVVLSTSDAGNTWTAVASLTGYNVDDRSSIHFIDSQLGFIAGVNPLDHYGDVILKTSDGGATWSEKEIPIPAWQGDQLSTIQFVDSTIGYAVGQSVIKTMDAGESWTRLIRPQGGGYLNDVCFFDENLGWVVSGVGHIHHTENGGYTWTEQTLNEGEISTRLTCVNFFDDRVGIIGGYDGTLLRTITAGF